MNDSERFSEAAPSTARVAELEARLDKARERAAAADRRLADAELAYAATGDGIAESLRAIELCTNRQERRRLLRRHLAAEEAATAEHQDRAQRWGPDVIGVPHPLPIGDPAPAAALILRTRIFGYYRINASTGTQKITLFVIPGAANAARRRRHLTRPAGRHCLTITDTITVMGGSVPDRLEALVGPETAADLTEILANHDNGRDRP
ncbi:hypothetical protein [Gordonia sihwensis]|uniref:hypothetical protein n=1 Tax=Gordonia sihwensis TaxID=173559 RepID=UPI0005EDA2AF|nr:hypothetical protein [Gordonia sihwensis]KJR10548.1 hypothetical protein UG54_00720 [Gordonia sihwensis]